MGLFDGVVGQPLAVAILGNALRKGAGHAYMFMARAAWGRRKLRGLRCRSALSRARLQLL